MHVLMFLLSALLFFTSLPAYSEPPSEACLSEFSIHARQQGFLDIRKYPESGIYVDMLPLEEVNKLYGEFFESAKAWYHHAYHVSNPGDTPVLRATARLDSKPYAKPNEGKVYFQAVLASPQCVSDDKKRVAFIAYDWIQSDGKLYFFMPQRVSECSMVRRDCLVWDHSRKPYVPPLELKKGLTG